MSLEFGSSINVKAVSATTCVQTPLAYATTCVLSPAIVGTSTLTVCNGGDVRLISSTGSNDTGDVVFYSASTANEWARLWASTDGRLYYRSACDGLVTRTIYNSGNISGATAGNATCLNGQLATFYQPASTAINTSNIASQSVNYATTAGNASCLGGNLANTYATYENTMGYAIYPNLLTYITGTSINHYGWTNLGLPAGVNFGGFLSFGSNGGGYGGQIVIKYDADEFWYRRGINSTAGTWRQLAPVESPTFTGTVTTPAFVISAAGWATTVLSTSGSIRWSYGKNNVAESGSNVGSDFVMYGFNDAGSAIVSTPITITRATGLVTMGTAAFVTSVTTPTVVSSGALTVNSTTSSVSLTYGGATKLATNTGGVCVTGVVNASSTMCATSWMCATDFKLSSDCRLKTNIKPIEISPVNIEYKQFELISEPNCLKYGVLAQDLQKDYPELVNTGEDGMMGVSYIGLLVKEVAYLKCRVSELEKRII